MARKQTSEFHKALQGTAYDTLRNANTRQAIDQAAATFLAEYPGSAWESLCAIRDHVNALLGAYRDMDLARRQEVVKRVSTGGFKGNPKGGLAALDELDRDSYTVADIHAETDRQGIPEI